MTVADLMLLGALVVNVAGAWMAIRAKPLGAHPYRWGNYLGTVMTAYGALVVLIGVWGLVLGSYSLPVLSTAVLGVICVTAGIGLLRRSTIGVLAMLASAVLLVVVNYLYATGDKAPVLNTLGALVVLGAPTAFYFRKRWNELSRVLPP